ncbi:MAG: TolC family protein [Chloroflexota bacterium]
MRKLSSVIFFFCAAAVWAAPLTAQETTKLSLQQAIDLALTGNRQLRAAGEQQEAAARGVGQARGAFFPRVDMLEGFSYTDKPTLVFSSLLDQASFKQENFALNSLNNPTPITNLSSQIRLEQPLYTGGRLSASLAQARANAEAFQEITKRTRQEVTFRVTEAYYNALLAEGNLGVVERALRSARAHMARAEDLFNKGLVVRSDFLRTQVLAGSLERERLEAENGVKISRSRLQHLMGIEGKTFQLTERVDADALPVEGLDTLDARAKELRPDLKVREKELEKAAEMVRAAEADFFPSVGFATQFEGNTRKFTSSGENFAVFLTARWNLFNGFTTQEKVKEAQAQLRHAQLLRDDLAQGVALDVEEAYLALLAARRQVTVASDNVRQADESLRILRDRYDAGLARNIDMLDGETALKRAEQDLLRSRVFSQIYRSRLKLATGDLQ